MSCPSGVVYLSSRSHAALYLTDGLVSYAEPSTAPGLGVRLVAGGRLDWQQWTDLRAAAMAQSDLPTMLLSSGAVTSAELGALLRSTIVDALFELLTAPAASWQARTVPSPTGWTGTLVRLPPEVVLDDAARAARSAATLGISVDDVLTPLDPTGDVVLTDAMWRLRWELDGRQTTRQLAWRAGTSLVETLDAEAGLLAAGLCAQVAVRPAPQAAAPAGPEREPAAGSPPGSPDAPPTGPAEPPGEPAGPAEDTVAVPVESAAAPVESAAAPDALPRRRPVSRPWDVPAGSGAGAPSPHTDVVLIERLLHALRDKG